MASVVIKSTDRSRIREAVEAYALRLRQEHPEIRRIFWFGSWVRGDATPGSDVDLCLILSASDKPPRDRLPDYLPLGFPVGLDLHLYTEVELEVLRTASPKWFAALTTGLEVPAN